MIKFMSAVIAFAILLSGAYSRVLAQQFSMPELQACKNLNVMGKATVSIASRRDASHSGEFDVAVDVSCRRGAIDRIGTLSIDAFNLNDTVVRTRIRVDHIDQMTSLGRAVTPTAFLSGTCEVERESIAGCRFLLMLVDNGKDGDIIGFVAIDGTGRRLAYGAGTLTAGDIQVEENE